MDLGSILLSATTGGQESTDMAAAAEAGHGGDRESDVIFFIFSSLCLGGIVKEINKKTAIPYTPMLFVIGVFLGKYKHYLGILEHPIDKMGNIDGHGLLMIFLPVLIFEGGFSCDWHLFRRQFPQIFILAFPAVVVSAFMLAFCLKIVLGYDDSYYTWTGAFLFGSILSCTDTVAVLALLKEAGASKKFNSLIEGESLINDGTCMILFQISSAMMKGKAAGAGAAFGLFFSLTFGGMALGLLFGAVSTFWIKKIFNDEVLVVNITFLTCYLLFYVAENIDFGFKISGIIALVALGLFMSAFGKTRISSEADHAVHTFWKYIVFCAETVIFLLAGMLVGIDVISESGVKHLETSDFYKIFLLYLCMLVVRFSAIAVFMPILKKIAYGLTWAEVIALAYGGLRGAIGIAFALIVSNDPEFPIKFRSIVLFQMAGAAVLTLIINGTTTGLIIKKLGMVTTTTVKRRYQIHFTQKMLEEIDNKIDDIKSDRFLNVVDWDKVKQFNCIDEYNKYIHLVEDQIKNDERERQIREENLKRQGLFDDKKDLEMNLIKEESKQSIVLNSEENPENQDDELDEASVTEARNKFLMALKGAFWELFEINQISGDSLILLMQATNFDIDNAVQRMSSWEFINMGLINKQYMNTLFKLKFTPLIGKIARNLLFNHISSAYDIVIGYIESHEKAEAIFKQFPLDERIISEIVIESNENKESAERYLHNYLIVSFPEITQQIQNKKAATTVLEQQKTALNENLKTGQIEEREFLFFKKHIDNSVKMLGELVPDWHMPPIREFLKSIPFFQYLDDKTLNTLLLESKDFVFENDVKVIKEQEKAAGFFVITRGCGLESSSKGTYKEKKGVGSTISTIHIIQSTFRYQTSFISESLFYCIGFKLNSIQKIVKNTPALAEYVWKDAIRVLTKMYSEELKPLSTLDNDCLSELITDSSFKKYKKNTLIDLTSGGIFLRGQAVEKGEKQEEININQAKPNITVTSPSNTLLSPSSIEKNSFNAGEGVIETIKEEDEVVENRMTNDHPLKPQLKEEKDVRKSYKVTTIDRAERDEVPKALNSLLCILPSPNPILFIAQKTSFVLHFSKSEETERILNFEKMSEKNWIYSMAMKPKKSSIRRSRKDLKFGQPKTEKKEVNV